MKMIVCGGRDERLDGHGIKWLNQITADNEVSEVVTGGQRGIDTDAHIWAEGKFKTHVIHADWDRHGKAAGPIRNRQMLDYIVTGLVVAFPGGRGTADMVKQAKQHKGVVVIEIPVIR